jgi:hypothetical protein
MVAKIELLIVFACIAFTSGKIAVQEYVLRIDNTYKSEVSSKFIMPKTLCHHYLPNGRMEDYS